MSRIFHVVPDSKYHAPDVRQPKENWNNDCAPVKDIVLYSECNSNGNRYGKYGVRPLSKTGVFPPLLDAIRDNIAAVVNQYKCQYCEYAVHI